ncbi:MAG: hypothetical protein ACHQ6U_05360 [Thermodesulfobacteriota bacterium]
MDKAMMWRLVGAFINVTILSRVAHLILKKWVTDSYRRSYIVLFSVALLDFAGVWALYCAPVTAIYVMLFYYLPLLIMWFLKDILDASREKGRAR